MGRAPVVPFVYENDAGEEIEVDLPAKWEICGLCRGNGTHSLAIDGHGITQEERDRDWDPEEWEAYLAGEYDSTCENCEGSGKVAEVDISALDIDMQKRYTEHLTEEAAYRRICEAERKYGA